MADLRKGRYCARFAANGADLGAVQRLRYQAFMGGEGVDADGHDPACRHVMIEDVATGALVCCFRLLALADGAQIARSYSAQFYGLEGLKHYPRPMAELGRFCIAPGQRDPDIIRLAWAVLTQFCDQAGIGLLFGCSSFRGTDAGLYRDTFALLAASHLGPAHLRPDVGGRDVIHFAQMPHRFDRRRALQNMPPLLRSYLAMGGWIGDHAVIDRDLNTLHVFTVLDIGAVPALRGQRLRSLLTGPPVDGARAPG
ncbi:MAG: GNAT family N-acyltransferase [Paracoccaceae bacterium]